MLALCAGPAPAALVALAGPSVTHGLAVVTPPRAARATLYLLDPTAVSAASTAWALATKKFEETVGAESGKQFQLAVQKRVQQALAGMKIPEVAKAPVSDLIESVVYKQYELSKEIKLVKKKLTEVQVNQLNAAVDRDAGVAALRTTSASFSITSLLIVFRLFSTTKITAAQFLTVLNTAVFVVTFVTARYNGKRASDRALKEAW